MKIWKIITCFVLIASMLATSMVPISAARATYYLSDLKLAEADTEEGAKKLLTDAGYTILDKNLNPDGDKAVYLGYKKSTNVDDAITDIRVMNMNGGFNVSDYETLKKDAIQDYKKIIDNYRIAAMEFAENYKIGKKEALLAYRQLNYYYVEKDGNKIGMGDYMLNFPEKNDDFADILFKGNPTVLDNIRNLLAMGVSDGGALIDRIKESVNDQDVYTKKEYYESAKELTLKTQQLKKLLTDAISEIEEIMADTTMTQEEKDAALKGPRYTATLMGAFDVILAQIPQGEGSNYSELFDKKTITDYSLLYPFVDAMTPGQLAMAVSGQLHSVLVYNSITMTDEELDTKLDEIEASYDPVSVYFGTDMSLLEGAVGVTSDALREEAATGRGWVSCLLGDGIEGAVGSLVLGFGGFVITYISMDMLFEQIELVGKASTNGSGPAIGFDETYILDESMDSIDDIADAASTQANTTTAASTPATASTATIVLSSLGIVLGLAIIGLCAYNILTIMSKYNVEYTTIPSNMVDTVETVNGNRYVNYTVVNSLYQDGDKTAEKPGDTNGYDGDQWNAIYFTKSYEAGKCMTATGYFIDSASNFGKYSPVALFGSTNCYNLNAHNGNGNSDAIYIAFANSNKKKTAETEVPTVVGSIFSYGAVAISGVVGLIAGMGLMAVVKRKKSDGGNADPEQAESEA